MQRYYKNARTNTHENSRSNRNKDLYGEIYTYGKYSNIEGIASIDNANEVDITKVKEMLKNRENYQKERKYRRITGEYKNPEPVRPTITRTFADLEEKNYDIRDVLKEAKENKEPDDKERVLKNTQYNILKNIDLKKELRKEDYYDEDSPDDLKDLIHTITSTSMLNKIGDAQLAADLLSDLKDDDTQIGEVKNIKDLIEQDEKYQEATKTDSDEPTYDHSFFTSSLKLHKSDFVDGDEQKKMKPFTIVLLIILVIIILVSAGILIVNSL